jgi:DNA repair exonuclease SbcCD ATPase subunit
MNHMAQTHTLRLYIEPEHGPVKPLELNLLEIESAVQANPLATGNRDEERFRLVARRITEAFPFVVPESNRSGIASILARFSEAYRFSGMVLHLAGTIPEAPTASEPASGGLDALKGELKTLSGETMRLKRLFEIEQQAHRTTKEQSMRRESEYKKQLQNRDTAYDRQKLKTEDLQERLRLQEEENRRISLAADQLASAHASLRTQYDLLKETQVDTEAASAALEQRFRELEARCRDAENALARARMEVRNAQSVEQSLRETITEQAEEIGRLEEERSIRSAGVNRGADDFTILP